MTDEQLPTCDDSNEGSVVVHAGEALVCRRGDWRRVRDGALFARHDLDTGAEPTSKEPPENTRGQAVAGA